jgi:hypothetical protein
MGYIITAKNSMSQRKSGVLSKYIMIIYTTVDHVYLHPWIEDERWIVFLYSEMSHKRVTSSYCRNVRCGDQITKKTDSHQLQAGASDTITWLTSKSDPSNERRGDSLGVGYSHLTKVTRVVGDRAFRSHKLTRYVILSVGRDEDHRQRRHGDIVSAKVKSSVMKTMFTGNMRQKISSFDTVFVQRYGEYTSLFTRQNITSTFTATRTW